MPRDRALTRVADAAEPRLLALLAEFSPRLRAIVLARCPRVLGVDPDEVEQDVRVRLWQALEREREILQPASYLYQTAMSVIVDHIRRRQARPDLGAGIDALEREPDAGTSDPADAAASGQFALAMVRAVDALPDRRRQVVQLHLRGFGTVEMGRMLGVTEATARNLLHRGLTTLREQLRAEGWHDE